MTRSAVTRAIGFAVLVGAAVPVLVSIVMAYEEVGQGLSGAGAIGVFGQLLSAAAVIGVTAASRRLGRESTRTAWIRRMAVALAWLGLAVTAISLATQLGWVPAQLADFTPARILDHLASFSYHASLIGSLLEGIALVLAGALALRAPRLGRWGTTPMALGMLFLARFVAAYVAGPGGSSVAGAMVALSLSSYVCFVLVGYALLSTRPASDALVQSGRN